jgi:tRNA U34 5-methylaminomethyl-2-thiouridine-forming methyltransferase MnmC
MTSPAWTPITTADGSITMIDPGGLALHDQEGAWTESRERYAAGCALAERALLQDRLRLLDVGTGLGLNLAAAMEAVDAAGARLEVTGFELHPEILEIAVALEQPDWIARWTTPVRTALRLALQDPESARVEGVALGARHHLWLFLGDAREALPHVATGSIDAVFLDPFAPAEAPELWSETFLSEVARTMDAGARLATYTASLSVRTRLAAAGLNVGSAGRVGRKAQGTLATRGVPVPPLEERSARKLGRRLERMGLTLPERPPE